MQAFYALRDGLGLYPIIYLRALNPKLILGAPGHQNWRRNTRTGTAPLLLQSTPTVYP